MKTSLRVLIAVLLSAFLFVAPALASPYLDFGIIAPTPGVISYAGGVAPLVGTSIQVDNVLGGGGTLLHNNVTLSCFSCVLNFTTGNVTGSDISNWYFGGGSGSVISIVGTAYNDANSNGTVDAGESVASGILMTGGFGAVSVNDTGGLYKVSIGTFTDTKLDALSSYYGYAGGPSVPWSGNFNISFHAAGAPPAGFTSSDVLSGDVVNSPVPEPGTLLLLGSALIGAVAFKGLRKK